MSNRNVLSIDFIRLGVSQFLRLDVRGELMSKEVKVDPFIGASADITAQQIPVEQAGLLDVTDRKSEVERFELAHNAYFRRWVLPESFFFLP